MQVKQPGRAVALLSVIAISAMWTSVASATPPDVFGYGPRTQGMAMTGASFVDDYEAVYANPAGLSRAERNGFYLGFQAGKFSLEVDGLHSPLDPYAGMTIGLQLPLPFGGPLEDVLVIAAGFFSPNGSVLQTEIIFPEVPSWVLLNRSQSVHLQLGLGIDLNGLVPGLRVGVGFAALANIGGRLSVVVDDANQFASETETQLLASFSPIVGVQYDAGPLSFGLVWHDDVKSDISLNIVTDLPLELPIITINATPQYDPHMFVGEVSWQPTEHWRLALQANVRLWSLYDGVVGRSTSMSNLPPAPAFRDTISPRLGVEFTTQKFRTRAWVRGGYAFEMTPAPLADNRPVRDFEGNPLVDDGEVVTAPVRYLDANRHVLTLGGGLAWKPSRDNPAQLRIQVFSQLHILESREHLIPSGFGGMQNMTTSGWIFTGGLSAGLEW